MLVKNGSLWLYEYYKIKAGRFFSRRRTLKAKIEATEASLKKWEGLRQNVLDEYGLTNDSSVICPKSDTRKYILVIGSTSCHLCELSDGGDEPPSIYCRRCPIFEFQGEPCDRGSNSPWTQWLDKNDPEPMIALLENTLLYLKTKKEEE